MCNEALSDISAVGVVRVAADDGISCPNSKYFYRLFFCGVGTVRSKGRWDEALSRARSVATVDLVHFRLPQEGPCSGQARPGGSDGTLLGFWPGLPCAKGGGEGGGVGGEPSCG